MAESILFVDDDCMVLNALERTFFETDYFTFFALNAIEGYKILEKENIDIVISDIRMLPVSGSDFLREVSKKYPDIIRVVLSAYSERNMMIKVICEGLAQVYILKPWDNQTLINQIRHLLSMYGSLSEIKSSAGIPEVSHMPMLPSFYTKMLKMIDENRSLKEVAALIETDPASTANVLHLANSSFYGMTISSVHQALVYLGISSVKDIVLVSELFSRSGESSTKDLRLQTSRHMVCTSMVLHGLHQHLLGGRIPDEFSVVGLLADIGRLFLIEYDSGIYRSVLQKYLQDPAIALTEREIQEIGFSHAQLGGLILDWWNLPASLIEASLYHHDYPFKSAILPEKVTALLHIADAFAWKKVESVSSVLLSEDILSLFSVTLEQLDDLVNSITERTDFVK